MAITVGQQTQGLRDKVDSLTDDMKRIQSAASTITEGQSDNRVNLRGLTDQMDMLTRSVNESNDHLKATDIRVNAIENSLKILDTNQQLINQQMQYIGTSHIIQPSTKK